MGREYSAGSCRSLNGGRFVVDNALHRGAQYQAQVTGWSLTEELVENESSTVATWNTGLSAAPRPVVLQPGHWEGSDPGDTDFVDTGDRNRADALRWQGLS